MLLSFVSWVVHLTAPSGEFYADEKHGGGGEVEPGRAGPGGVGQLAPGAWWDPFFVRRTRRFLHVDLLPVFDRVRIAVAVMVAVEPLFLHALLSLSLFRERQSPVTRV